MKADVSLDPMRDLRVTLPLSDHLALLVCYSRNDDWVVIKVKGQVFGFGEDEGASVAGEAPSLGGRSGLRGSLVVAGGR